MFALTILAILVIFFLVSTVRSFINKSHVKAKTNAGFKARTNLFIRRIKLSVKDGFKATTRFVFRILNSISVSRQPKHEFSWNSSGFKYTRNY